MGLLGLLLAPVLRLTVKDPKRGGMESAAAHAAVAAAAEGPAASKKVGLYAALFMFFVAALCAAWAVKSGIGAGLSGPGAVWIFAAGLAAVIGLSVYIARSTASVVMNKKSFWLLALGAASSSVCGYGVAGWLPLFFMRSFGLTLTQVSWYYSGIALVGGVAGIWMGGLLADRLGKRSKAAYPLVPAIAFLISAPCFILAMNSGWLIEQVMPGSGGNSVAALTMAFLIFLIPTGLNLVWLGPITASVQHLVPAPMRTTASALFLLLNNLLGIAVGFYYFGWMSDLLAPRFGEESLRWAIYTGMGFYVLAALLLIGASRTLKKDWVD